MRTLILSALLVAMLAGCAADEETPDTGTPTETPCTLLLPDGSEQGCADKGLDIEQVASSPPSLDEGFVCTGHYDRKGRDVRIYTAPGGGMGAFWDWTDQYEAIDLPAWGIRVGSIAAYHDEGDSFVHTPGDLVGYTEFPVGDHTATGSTNVVVYTRTFFLRELVDDEWVNRTDAELIRDKFEGDPWYAWKVNTTEGPVYIDINQEIPSSSGARLQPSDELEVEVGNTTFRSTVWQVGILFTNSGAPVPKSATCLAEV